MTIYIDGDCRAYTEPRDDREAVEASVFDSMPAPVIACHRYIPTGTTWISPDGLEIHGEFIQMCVSQEDLDAAQREYERQMIAEYEHALSEIEAALGVSG